MPSRPHCLNPTKPVSYRPLNYPRMRQSLASSTLFDSGIPFDAEIPLWERIRSGSRWRNAREINGAACSYFHATLIVVLFCCRGSNTFGQDESAPKSQSSSAASPTDPPPHPWIETAPPAFARLISLGRVQIKIDDQRLDEARKQALTHFKIKADYRYLYTQQSTRVDPKNDGGYVAKINARIIVPEVEILHEISIRSGFNPRDPWKSPLMKHEFDHVSISTDPRLLKLLKKILNRKISIDVRWTSDEHFSDEIVSRAIKAEINTQIAEIERVVQANYDRLDRETRDGTMDAKDRETLFTSMYKADSLRTLKFSYLDATMSIVQDSRDKDVLEHYSLLAPP